MLHSLHHVTATVADAQEDLDCYIGLLGMRLVKKTVNFDNHNVYHFYYGNERGTPSTLMTTFPYKGWGVPVGTKGAGQITITSFSVPAASLDFWRQRLSARGVAYRDVHLFAEDALHFADPSGLELRLVGTSGDERLPWITPEIGADAAIRGLYTATLTLRAPARSLQLLTEVLGFQVVNEDGRSTRVAVGGNAPGHYLDLVHDPDAPAAVNGLGTVHHVALAVGDGEDQLRMRSELVRLGYRVTEVRDRQYFTSIYFREPGGVLYEIATLPPGFTVDEELSELGSNLKLPPWEEPHREAIVKGLPAITYSGVNV